MSAAPPGRILLLQLHHLGDVVLTTPAIRATRRTFPQARIDFVTGRFGAQALEGNPHLDNILVEPSLIQLHRTRYHAAVDMHSITRTALYTAATRARVRSGIRGRGPRNLAYTHLRPRELGSVYMARQKLRVLAPLGVDAEGADLTLEIAIDEEQRAWAGSTLARLRKPIVAISPVARYAFKQWGGSRWAQVADALAARGASILLTSGPGEGAQAAAMALAMKDEPLWRYGSTTVRQLAALYEHCVLWLGNDGGPKHIAVAAGIPTVTVYRRNLGGVWSDPGPKQIAINSGSDTPEPVDPQQVIAAALQLLPG